MPWIDAEVLLRRVAEEESEFWESRYRLDAPCLAEPDDRLATHLTVDEAAERLGVTANRVRQLISARHLQADVITKRGRPSYRLSLATVMEYQSKPRSQRSLSVISAAAEAADWRNTA